MKCRNLLLAALTFGALEAFAGGGNSSAAGTSKFVSLEEQLIPIL